MDTLVCATKKISGFGMIGKVKEANVLVFGLWKTKFPAASLGSCHGRQTRRNVCEFHRIIKLHIHLDGSGLFEYNHGSMIKELKLVNSTCQASR